MIFLIIHFSIFIILITILYFNVVYDCVGTVEKFNLIKSIKHITYGSCQ